MDGTTPLDRQDPLMSIGTFSRASLVSVKALRSYHEQGLLIPDSIDPDTGYRSYRVSQLTDAAIIARLRDLDIGLKDIAEVVRARDPEVTRKVIAEHESEMRERLNDVTRIIDQLHQSIDLPSLQTPVHARTDPDTHVLLVDGDVDVDAEDYASFLHDAFGRLFAAVTASGAAMSGPSGACYPTAVDTDRAPVQAFIPITDATGIDGDRLGAGVTIGLLPAATCAVMTHLGGYDSIGDTYRNLGAWVARNATPTDQPVREHYLVSIDPATGELLPDDQLRTEIAWPVVPQPSTTESRTNP